MYDYLIVGAGLFGNVWAHEATKRGKKCLVIDRRNHIGGNTYCQNVEGINVHTYGAHIFHTNDKDIWDYVNSFMEFNRYTNSPVANYYGALHRKAPKFGRTGHFFGRNRYLRKTHQKLY